MNKYQAIYETLWPADKLGLPGQDPRRDAIIAEMKQVCNAATPAEAAKFIDWWGWESDQHRTSFIVRARKLARAK